MSDSCGGLTCAQNVNSWRERLDRSCRLFAAMPDSVNFFRVADVQSGIAIKDHQVGKLSWGQHPTILQLQQCCGIGGGKRERLQGRESGFDRQCEFPMLRHSSISHPYPGIGPKPDPHPGIMEGLEILLVVGDRGASLRSRWRCKHALPVGGIIQQRVD